MSNTNVWGPPVWYFMHKVAYELPQNNYIINIEKRKKIKSFYRILRWLLPCSTCRKHYGSALGTKSLLNTCDSGKKFAKWTVIVHNRANLFLHKPLFSYNNALKLYKNKTNHNKLRKFIKYILVNSENSPISNRKSIANYTILFYPCYKCKKRLSYFLKINSLDKINSRTKMTEWAIKLLNLAKKDCI